MPILNTLPEGAKAFNVGMDIKLLPLQGATAPTHDTQGVASLALGYVHHWAFSPSLLNPKLQLVYIIMFRISRYALAHSFAHKHRFHRSRSPLRSLFNLCF